jgi:uroporphyrinogen decarboxylase
MNKLERVKAALRGEAVDRPPYAFWTHMPGIDLDPDRLAEETAAFAARYDLDFVKSMPNGLYCVEDWGVATDYSEIERGGVAKVVRPAVVAASDWDRLGAVDVAHGAYGREVAHLRALVARLGASAHIAHLERDSRALARALAMICDVTCTFVAAAIDAGCAGLFFAVQDATASKLDVALYRAQAEPHDRRVLRCASECGGWFNVLHMHGDDVMFDVLKDYEATALNWHIGETPPSIAEYRAAGGTRPVVGGLQRGAITRRDFASVRADIERAMAESQGRGILLAPGCLIRHPVDEATLDSAIRLIKGAPTGGTRPPPSAA